MDAPMLVRYFAVYDRELRDYVYCSRNYFHTIACVLMMEHKRNPLLDEPFRFEFEDCVYVPTAYMLPSIDTSFPFSRH